MSAVSRRVNRLEGQFRVALEAMRQGGVSEGLSPAEVLRAKLAEFGIHQAAHESMAETAARAMGCSVFEFRQMLMRGGSDAPGERETTRE